MKTFAARTVVAVSVATGLGLSAGAEQAPVGTPEMHVEAARKAAGNEHMGVFNVTCGQLNTQPRAAATAPAPRPPGPPPRDSWHAEPAKVFDNLYFLGQTEFTAWAVTTSQGIIVIDTIFDYSIEDEVVDGMKKLGLDPAQIKYAIVSHGHFDHSGGAKYLQEKFGTRVILSAADWELLEKYHDGLIATTGCLGGHVLQSLLQGDEKGALDKAGRLQEIFGKDHLFVELQDHGLPAQRETNPRLIEIARRIGAPLIATNDSCPNTTETGSPGRTRITRKIRMVIPITVGILTRTRRSR